MAGDGGLDILPEQIDFLAKAGATAIELGIPFSDPVADGPTIQEAGLRALANGTTLTKVLDRLAETKGNRDIPIVLMTYLNPIYLYGTNKFAKACLDAGVAGVIVPDLPLEESALLKDDLTRHEIALIQLVALTSPQERLERIASQTEGFLYAVTVTGTTGTRTAFADQVGTYLHNLKQISPVPVLAGFGVSTPEHVQSLSHYCDGVVVGSKIVASLNQGKQTEIKSLIDAAKSRSK